MARILVADDDASVREVIRRALVAAGHAVEEAGDGQTVLDLYAHRERDLLLLDLYMPGMDGLETMIRLKAERPQAKVVAMSGGGYRHKHDVLAMALQAGATATLAKPFEVDHLLATVQAALGAPEAAGAPAAEPAPPKATVLVVEDDQRARAVLRNRLKAAGYAVVEAPDAERAIEQFRARPTDAVIADLILPGKSGAHLIATLRKEAATAGIIAISGAPERLAALGPETANGAGFRTLPKPFTTEQLLDALDAVLAKDRQPRAPAPAAESWRGAVLAAWRRTTSWLWRS